MTRTAENKYTNKSNSTLRFTPYAWSKMNFMLNAGDTEVGGFGVCDNPDDLLLVTDFYLIEQECTSVTVEFDDDALNDYFYEMATAGYQPQQFGRVWIHTHPNMNPNPSSTDYDTFTNKFGNCNWSIMFILANDGQCYAELQVNEGISINQEIPVAVDWTYEFSGTDVEAWRKEFDELVTEKVFPSTIKRNNFPSRQSLGYGSNWWISEEEQEKEEIVVIDDVPYKFDTTTGQVQEWWDEDDDEEFSYARK